MIPSSIKDYVKIYDDFLDAKFCKNILNEINKSNWQTHMFLTYQSELVQHENQLSVSWNKGKFTQELQDKLWYAIERYILKDFHSFHNWYEGWNGYTKIRFNKYDKNTKMREHCDHIHTMFDGKIKGIPILSIVGCLNEDYEGGEFIMWQTEKIEIPEGAVLIFPSTFMYPHKVNPVTKGTRYSYVSWVY